MEQKRILPNTHKGQVVLSWTEGNVDSPFTLSNVQLTTQMTAVMSLFLFTQDHMNMHVSCK
jgi:hypothetical protein